MVKTEQIERGRTFAYPGRARGMAPFQTVLQVLSDMNPPLVSLRGEWGSNPGDGVVTYCNEPLDKFAADAICEATAAELKKHGILLPRYTFAPLVDHDLKVTHNRTSMDDIRLGLANKTVLGTVTGRMSSDAQARANTPKAG